MYYCEDCGAIFSDEEAEIKEYYSTEEVWGAMRTVVERECFCPDCGAGSEEFSEAEQCVKCGDWVAPPNELDEDGLCKDCVGEE